MLVFVVNTLVFLAAFSGTVLISHKNKWGFICFTVVETGYMYIGLTTQHYGLVAIAVMYFFTNIYGWLKWSKHDKLHTEK